MKTYASDIHNNGHGRKSSGGDYVDATVATIMLDHYGLGYICSHPEILFANPFANPFADPCRPGGDIASRMYGHDGYAGRQDSDVPYAPESLLDRMVEAYRILEQIFSPYKPYK